MPVSKANNTADFFLPNDSQSSDQQQTSALGLSTGLASSVTSSSICRLPLTPLSIPAFCVSVMSSVLAGLSLSLTIQLNKFDSPSLGPQMVKLYSTAGPFLSLLNTAIDLFILCLQPATELSNDGSGLGRETVLMEFAEDMLCATSAATKDLLPTRNAVMGLEELLELWGIVLSSLGASWRDRLEMSNRQEGLCPDTYHGEPGLCYTRFMYVGLGRGLFRLVSTIWTPETCASALPNVTASELALLLLDMNMLRAAYQQPPDTPRPSNLTGDGATATPAGLAAYVRFLDPEVTLLHEELQQVGHSLEAGVTFVRNFESLKTKTGLPVENMLTLAINALNAIDFLAPEFIEKFIVFLSELPLISEAQMVAPLLTKSRQHLICLMGHPSSLVRNAAYSSLFKILKVNLSVDQAANPSGRGCERLLFLLSSEVLGELIEFGVRDPDSKITTVARDCLRLLLDGHQLMSTEIWRLFCHILTSGAASPSVAEYLLKATCWSPLLPLIVGIAPLASLEPEEGASVADVKNSRLLARRALDVCLSTGGFHVPTQPLLPADPSALFRLRASSVLAALFDARFNLILPLFDLLADSGIENARYNSNQPEYSANAITTLPSAHLVPLASINDSRSDFAAPNARSTPISEFLGLHTRTDLEHRLCDLLLFSQPPSVLVSSFVEFRTSATLLVYGREQPAEAKSSMANLVTQLYSETVNMDLRCTAGDQIFVLLQYPGGIKEWCSAGGISAFLNWFSSLPRLLLSFTDKVLIESLLKTNLAIVQCAATNDVAVRIGLLMDRNSLYNLVFVGLCYAKNDDIRHCVAHLLSLLLFNCSIRESEGSPICLPDSIVRSYCLPFTCPVYVINSRHNIQHPRLPRLSMQLALTKQVRTDDPSGHIASQVDSVNDSTRVLRDQRIPIAVCRSLRSLWARMCHGGVSQLVLSLSGSKLASRESSTPDSPFKEGHANLDQYSHFVNDAFLAFSPTDAFLLLASSPHYALYEAVDSIRSASSHLEACCGLARFLLVHAVFWRTSLSLPQEAIDGQWWKLADIQRFFKVLPACAADYQLLIQCLEAIRTADFCPPYQSASSDSRFFNRAETALWILQNLIQPHSPLAYSLLRFDAGVGLTDSQRLIQMKEELHFETLPRLFNQALELLNFSISHKNCRVDDPLNSPKSAISESGSQSSETTILTAASTSTNIDEDFKVQLNDARLCSLFELIVDLIMRLQTQTDQHHEGFFGAAVIRTALMLLHNLLLRSASRRNRVSSALVDSSHKKWLDSPWLFHLLHYQCSELVGGKDYVCCSAVSAEATMAFREQALLYATVQTIEKYTGKDFPDDVEQRDASVIITELPVRLFALHVLSEACLISDWLERLTSLARYFDTSHFWQPTQEPFPAGSALWGLGLRFLLNPTLSARMRCAAAHLLINLSTVLAADKLTVCYLPPDLASASSLANMFLPGITGTMTKGKQDAVGDDGSRVGQRNFLQYVSRLAQQEGDVELGDHSPSDSSIETSTSGSRAKSSVSCTERSNICDLPFFKPGRSFSLNIKRLSGPVGLSDMTCLLLSEVATMQQRQRVVESRASRASPVVSSVNGISPSSFATDGDELHFTVMDLPDRLVAPTFIESNTKISRQTDDAISGHENKGRVEGVESSLSAPSSPSPPYLMSYVCRLVTSLVLLLPDLMVQRFTDLQFPQILMNIIDPELLKVLGNYSHVHRYPYLLGTHLVSAYAECLRCFRCLICLNERTKLSFLSDSRFLALVVQILSISQGNLNLESLWREQMLFFISLLEPETEDPEDLLLRHALHPLAAKATSWGGLVNRLIGRSVHLNEATLSGKTSRCLHDAERNRTFDMTRTAAIFLSVVLSRRSSRTLNALRMQGVMNGSSIQSKLQTTTSVSPDSLRASVYFDNPVPSALDKAVGRTELDEFWDLRHEDERQAARSVSGCIAISLATLTESFPQPRIGLDGCYLSSTDHRQINSEECGTPDSSVPIFGLSSAHRQAVHSALRILLCTSPMAKRAVLAGFSPTGRSKRRYKDTLKKSLKQLKINPATWEGLALDILVWRRSVKTGSAIYEATGSPLLGPKGWLANHWHRGSTPPMPTLSTYILCLNRPGRTSSDSMQQQSPNINLCHTCLRPHDHHHPYH
ncbi:unnamed protein product [Schistocephalus solidus]|uniref:Protein MON2 homolog n=1 Tax=Schistocephalus solidus TaxID=70667 RepID=A0A183SL68_SCHSO|nr:unnamed protein product [Schistocephalus solidus]